MVHKSLTSQDKCTPKSSALTFSTGFWVSSAILLEKKISLQGTMMTTSWPLELALTWPLPHPPPKLSPLIGLPTQDFHVTVPFPRMFLPLQSLLISPGLLSPPQRSHSCPPPAPIMLDSFSPHAGRRGSSGGNDNTESQLRDLSAYFWGLFLILLTCIISFTTHCKKQG